MGKIAFIYPGQASQFVGMGAEFYETYPIAREYYAQANKILGFSLTKVSFEGPEEELKQTQITQPAIFVLSVLISAILKEKGLTPQMVAGHSLGEYSALVAAGALSFEDALKVVQVRGKLMQQAGEEQPGMMAAIIGLNEDKICQICDEASLEGEVQAANFNAPNQIVISGTQSGVSKAMALAKGSGAIKVVPLITSGAFHSNLMNSAKEGLREVLETVELHNPTMPVYVNVTSEPITSAAQIKMALYKQVTHPVRWAQSVQNMIGDGAETFYEVGPKKVLSALMRRNHRQVNTSAIGTVADIEDKFKKI